MKKIALAFALIALSVNVGCSVRPVSKTIDTVKRVHDTTGKVYRAGKAVKDLVNPLNLIFVSVPEDEAMGGAPPQSIQVYDPQTGELLGVIAHPDAVAATPSDTRQ